jgi:GTPase SAR1 family protein
MISQPENFPFMVIGNKLDLENEARSVPLDAAKKYCKNNGIADLLETSAYQNKNVEEAFHRIATQALKRQLEMQNKLDES